MLSNCMIISFEKNEAMKNNYEIDCASYHRTGTNPEEVLIVLDILKERIKKSMETPKQETGNGKA